MQEFDGEQLVRRHLLRRPQDTRWLDFWSHGVTGDASKHSLLWRIEGHDPNTCYLWIPAFEFWNPAGTRTAQSFPCEFAKLWPVDVRVDRLSEAPLFEYDLLIEVRDFVGDGTRDACRTVVAKNSQRILRTATSMAYKPSPELVDGAIEFDMIFLLVATSAPICGFTLSLCRGERGPRERVAQISLTLGEGWNGNRWAAGELEMLHDMARRGLHPSEPVYDVDCETNPWSFARMGHDGLFLIVPARDDWNADDRWKDYVLHVDWHHHQLIGFGGEHTGPLFS
jgi:hypothetical protein